MAAQVASPGSPMDWEPTHAVVVNPPPAILLHGNANNAPILPLTPNRRRTHDDAFAAEQEQAPDDGEAHQRENNSWKRSCMQSIYRRVIKPLKTMLFGRKDRDGLYPYQQIGNKRRCMPGAFPSSPPTTPRRSPRRDNARRASRSPSPAQQVPTQQGPAQQAPEPAPPSPTFLFTRARTFAPGHVGPDLPSRPPEIIARSSTNFTNPVIRSIRHRMARAAATKGGLDRLLLPKSYSPLSSPDKTIRPRGTFKRSYPPRRIVSRDAGKPAKTILRVRGDQNVTLETVPKTPKHVTFQPRVEFQSPPSAFSINEQLSPPYQKYMDVSPEAQRCKEVKLALQKALEESQAAKAKQEADALQKAEDEKLAVQKALEDAKAKEAADALQKAKDDKRAARKALKDARPMEEWFVQMIAEQREKQRAIQKVIEEAKINQDATALLSAQEELIRVTVCDEDDSEEKLLADTKICFTGRDGRRKAKRAGMTVDVAINDEWNAKVDEAMATKDPSASIGTHRMTRKDMGTLVPVLPADGEGYLNDEIVNAFLGAIVKARNTAEGFDKVKGLERHYAPTVAMSTHFYTKWQKTGYAGVARWIKRTGLTDDNGKSLLNCDRILIPINHGFHWTLLVICGTTHRIEYYDSLGGTGAKYEAFARDIIQNTIGKYYDPESWVFADVPSVRQANGIDCGVFVCMNGLVSVSLKDPMRSFATEGIPSARRMIAATLLGRDIATFKI